LNSKQIFILLDHREGTKSYATQSKTELRKILSMDGENGGDSQSYRNYESRQTTSFSESNQNKLAEKLIHC